MGLLERIQSIIHFLVELWSNSEVQIPSIEPAKQLWQMGNVGKYELWFIAQAGIPPLFKIAITRRLSCRIFQMNVRIFKGNFTFQINLQTT